ncbi:MAG: outer membrane lipoprotein LolB, partial [Azoarcus sp.]|nr:outer membrane lipoprotein LolB [Azoarcus sp.]
MSHTARAPRFWMAALAAGLLSSGCILNPPAPAAVAIARQAADAFSLSGRISVSDGSQSANGRIDWQRHPGADSLTIISPLGQIVVRVTSGPEGAEAVFANGERQSAPQITDLVPLILPGAAEVGLPPER